MLNKDIIIIGYSGHAFVACEIIDSMGLKVTSYCDKEKKIQNPYEIIFLGNENSIEVLGELKKGKWFVAIGNNKLREKITNNLLANELNQPITIVHESAIVSFSVKIDNGVMISPGVILNAQSIIGKGVICNTGSIIEHECELGDFAHIAPGVVLAGNVKVGKRSFVGANSSVKEGVTIGNDVIIGAGSVIIKDIPDNVTVVGNPGRILNKKLKV